MAAPILDTRARGLGLEQIPALSPLLAEKRWCGWDVGPVKGRPDKWTKVPRIAGSVREQRVNDLSTAMTYAQVRDAVADAGKEGGVDGVGFLLLDYFAHIFLDFDNCRNPLTGELAPWAQAILAMMPGVFRHVTPSGTGLRVIGRANLDVAMTGRLRMRPFLTAQDDEGLVAWGGSRECEPNAMVEVFFACARYNTVCGWGAEGSTDVDAGGVGVELWQAGELQEAAKHKRGEAGAKRLALPGRVRTADIDDVTTALDAMVNEDESWFHWTNIGMAAHYASGGDLDAYEAFVRWSAKSGLKHHTEVCEERWSHWATSPANNLGIGTLAWHAEQANVGWIRPSKLRGCAIEFEVWTEEDEQRLGELAGDGEDTSGAPTAFRGLAERLVYVRTIHRWHDSVSRLLLDEARLRLLAEELRVKGAQLTGRKSLAARLAQPGSGMRRAVGITMRPGGDELVREADGVCLNLYRPSDLVALKGAREEDAKPWLHHAARLIPDEADRKRLIDRLAWALQNPGKKINSALVLLGGQENGKDTLLVPFWAAIGEHNHAVAQGSKLGGQFNSYMEKPWLLISEMPPAHKRDFYEEIKGMLTTPPDTIRINRKGLEEFEIPNIINVIATTNHIAALALAEDDRRFDIVMTILAIEAWAGSRAYYDELHAWYRAGGNAAVFGYLLARDVSAFSPHERPPMTMAKREMAREGGHPAVSWVVGLWDEGRPMHGRDLCTATEIVDQGQHGRWQANNAVARSLTLAHALQGLRMVSWRGLPQQVADGDSRSRVWCVPTRWLMFSQASPAQLGGWLEADRRTPGCVGRGGIP